MQETLNLERAEEAPGPLQTILIVEDDANIGEFLVEVLKEETPYQAMHVEDGFAALQEVRSVTPGLILLDYQLPGMNGLECLGLLQASKGMEHVPIMLMSAGFPKQVRERSDLQLLEKPFELDALLHLVQQVLVQKK